MFLSLPLFKKNSHITCFVLSVAFAYVYICCVCLPVIVWTLFIYCYIKNHPNTCQHKQMFIIFITSRFLWAWLSWVLALEMAHFGVSHRREIKVLSVAGL